MKKRFLRPLAVCLALAIAALVTTGVWLRRGEGSEKLRLDQFERALVRGDIETATVKDRDHAITGQLHDDRRYSVNFPEEYGDELTAKLSKARVEVDVDRQRDSLLVNVVVNLLPILVLFGLFLVFMHAMQGGNRVLQFGRSRARRVGKDEPKVTFADVAGCDEAVEELREIKEFLEDPERFFAIGAKIPKGVLLYGPPGTGKTLLARAVAGEAGVPFFSISGSDFVEMFVGVGASRVRDLFEQAKSAAPAIVFIDEIDAVGRHRGAGLGGGHDEREQTLNQLLVEMDGFETGAGVILMAATNRPDILDPALLRPGRFDRQIVVDRPDLAGRRAILTVHARARPLAEAVQLDVLARRTPGFTGADLANLMNEAALLAARWSHPEITMTHLEHAIDRVIAGPERKSRVMSERERQVIAYHEAGHALVGHVLPNCDPIHKVSIIARGRALGWTLSLPTEDKNLRTRAELRDQLAMALGGRSAEELIFGDPTTGAADDIEVVSQLARAMVTEYGMSDLVGPQQLGQRGGEVFLGRDYGHEANYSDQVASVIDAEVRRLIDEAHREAAEILRQHRPTLDRLAEALVDNETLDEVELAALFDGLEPWESTGDQVVAFRASAPTAQPASIGPRRPAGVTPAIRAWVPNVRRWLAGVGARRALRPGRRPTTARPEVSR